MRFQKDKNFVWALIDFASKANAMTPTYAAVLGFKVYLSAVRAQKIDGFSFKNFDKVIANFQVWDKLGKACFF